MRLSRRELPKFRNLQLDLQQGRCCLCDDVIDGDAVLDHDHDTGEIRGVLHRGCNALLGKIENNMTRNRVNMGRLAAFSNNLIDYLTADPCSELLHPTFLTPEERRMKAYKKKKKKAPGKKKY